MPLYCCFATTFPIKYYYKYATFFSPSHQTPRQGQHCYQALCYFLLERDRPEVQAAKGAIRQDIHRRNHNFQGKFPTLENTIRYYDFQSRFAKIAVNLPFSTTISFLPQTF